MLEATFPSKIWVNFHRTEGRYKPQYRMTITIFGIIRCPVFYLKLNSVGFSVPHRKHITSPLRAQQVNAIYSFVMIVK
jgi:hypothetical protein